MKIKLFEQFKPRKATYIGNCTHVGTNSNYPICKYFSDATEMAQVVGNPDENIIGENVKDMTLEQFNQIYFEKLPKKLEKLVNKAELQLNNPKRTIYVQYIWRNWSPWTNSYTIYNFEKSGFFWIYDEIDDIHCFFSLN